MDITSAPDTHPVIVLSVGFSDGSHDSVVIDERAGDIWNTDERTGDITLHFAPRAEKTIKGRGKPMLMAAKPQETVVWFKAHIRSIGWRTVQSTDYPLYQPASTS